MCVSVLVVLSQHFFWVSGLDLLDFTLLDSLLVQVLDELLPLHPVDEWADFAAVAKEGSARQVEGTSCSGKERETKNCHSFIHFLFPLCPQDTH